MDAPSPIAQSDLRTGGRWFDPRLGQYSFRGLMIVIAKGFIPLSPLSVVSKIVMWESSQYSWKEYCAEYRLKELQQSMGMCTGRRDITEILLKTVSNPIQPTNGFDANKGESGSTATATKLLI